MCDPEGTYSNIMHWTDLTCASEQGSEREPGFPRPIVFELDMYMPLLRMNETPGQLEEK